MDKEKLLEWQSKYEISKSAFEGEIRNMVKNEQQYYGELQPDNGGQEVKCLFNFTKELIESAIDTTIPLPKVEPMVKTDRNKELARTVEAMLMNQIKRLDLETLNDTDERTTKIMGGNVALVEWNNSEVTYDHVGEIEVRLISPTRFTPQEGVYKIKTMDYFFLSFEDTKERIKKKYGISVENEGVDIEEAESTTSDETVTQVWAFYRNEKGSIGLFSWVGETVVIDDEEYQARGSYICKKCGASKTRENICPNCGSSEFEFKHLDYEELKEDIVLSDGTVIPAMDYAKDEAGNYLLQEVEKQVTELEPESGTRLPVYDYILNEYGIPVGETPRLELVEEVYKVPTKIPYYVPTKYPASIRQNISNAKKVFGDSDAESIKVAQLESNKNSTVMLEKMRHNGYILTKHKSTNLTFSNGIQTLEVETPDELAALKTLNLTFDVNGDVALINQMYLWAKSLLGINDSAQGKADPTAVSGRAKEAQISRALARQGSKAIMKNAFYKDLYASIFQYALAYMDEPRTYVSPDERGEETEYVFNRYDFLEKGMDGQWRYNDQFIITIDQMAGAAEDRGTVLEMMQADYGAGLYGNPQDPETILQFWKDRESLNYPNAKRQVARWQKKIDDLNAQNEMMIESMNMNGTTVGEPVMEVEDEDLQM